MQLRLVSTWLVRLWVHWKRELDGRLTTFVQHRRIIRIIFTFDTDSWSSLICLSLAFCSSWVICISCSNLSVSAELLVDSSFAFSNSFSAVSRAFCISANLLSGEPPLYKTEIWKIRDEKKHRTFLIPIILNLPFVTAAPTDPSSLSVSSSPGRDFGASSPSPLSF